VALYDYDFCHRLVNGKGWDKGIIAYLEDAQHKIKKNFADMDLENASVGEEMQVIVDEMVAELNRLINDIESVNFR
jgi:hypothetical protein